MAIYDPLGEIQDNLARADKIGVTLGRIFQLKFCFRIQDGPLQLNPYDCGIFVISAAIRVSQGGSLQVSYYVDGASQRKKIWLLLLKLWWREQRRLGTAGIQRARGLLEILDSEDYPELASSDSDRSSREDVICLVGQVNTSRCDDTDERASIA